MPAQEHAHRRRSGLVCAGSSSNLAESLRGLLGRRPRCVPGVGGSRHTLINVLHQYVQALAATLGSVDALEQRAHVARLDGLKDLNNGLHMGILCTIVAVVDGGLQAPSQGTLGIASSQELPDLASKLSHLGLGDLGLRGVEGRGVEVEAGVFGQGIDVDRAPGIAQRGAGVLLDDGHCAILLLRSTGRGHFPCAVVMAVRGARRGRRELG